jgi:hypothetical protein
MKKNIIVNPTGLKGNQINERMKELMGIAPINESVKNSVIELTKIGPDGNVYAVVRENHKYFIKSTSKKENLTVEDFNYIGGLQNKTDEAYPSYSKALKHLNFKFNSLAEAYNAENGGNICENDSVYAAGYTDAKSGFSNEGNLEGNEPLVTEDEPVEEDVELTEEEQAVHEMTEEMEDECSTEPITENRLSIGRALTDIDGIIDSLNEGKKKIYKLK